MQESGQEFQPIERGKHDERGAKVNAFLAASFISGDSIEAAPRTIRCGAGGGNQFEWGRPPMRPYFS
jgi:hypothetical protein